MRPLASLADYRLNTINVEVVERFRDKLKDEGKLSRGTINRVLTTGAAVFNLRSVATSLSTILSSWLSGCAWRERTETRRGGDARC